MNQYSRPMFLLLLAATLGVDAVAVYWLYSSPHRAAANTLFEGLSASQISLLCAWATLGTNRRIWVPLTPFAAAMVVAAIVDSLGLVRLADTAAVYTCQILGLMAVLWILKGTKWWWRDTGRSNAVSWQFSLSQFLIVMTVLILAVMSLKDAEESRSLWKVYVPFVIGTVLLPVAAVLVWGWGSHGSLRLATTLGIAVVIAIPVIACVWEFWLSTACYYLIQALVLWLWLELGEIIPRPSDAPPASP